VLGDIVDVPLFHPLRAWALCADLDPPISIMYDSRSGVPRRASYATPATLRFAAVAASKPLPFCQPRGLTTSLSARASGPKPSLHLFLTDLAALWFDLLVHVILGIPVAARAMRGHGLPGSHGPFGSGHSRPELMTVSIFEVERRCTLLALASHLCLVVVRLNRTALGWPVTSEGWISANRAMRS
jgi:hypothetical protein